MELNFTKMHGLGNDFILIDAVSQESLKEVADKELSSLAMQLCRRRFGVGADQLLMLSDSDGADFRMRIFNADGSEIEMCGNGIRCLAKYIWDRGLSSSDILEIETPAGIISPARKGALVRVDMGVPEFGAANIPLDITKLTGQKLEVDDKIIDYPLIVEQGSFDITCLSMGNPHCVIITDDLDSFPVSSIGPEIERDPLFPKRTNIEFVKVLNKREISMRVWERGAGETMACGTGASASAVATAVKNLTGREVTVHLPGGDLFIEWAIDGHLYMTGPAESVFEGAVTI